MDRPTATNYLQEEYADLATETGWAAGMIATAYSVVIDQSLRQLGYTEAQLASTDVGQSLVVNYLALLDYYALLRYAKFFAIKVDVTIGPRNAVAAKRSQVAAHVNALLAWAETRLRQLGIGPVEQLAMGRMTLDFLEPSVGEF